MDWTLERVNGPKNFTVLEKGERSYTCGRLLTNKIVCPSLVVSRRHCIFVRADDVISVIDLRSANGIYVNQRPIEANVLIELKENDIIGIGSSDEYRNDEPMFVFRLHKGNLSSRNLEEFDELLTQRSSASSINVKPTNNSQPSVTFSNERTLKRSLPEKIKDNNGPFLPPKICKLNNETDKIPDRAAESTPSSSSKAFRAESPEVEEIEEIFSTLSSQKPKTNGSLATEASDPIEKSGNSLNRSNRMTLNIENEKGSRKSSCKVQLVDGETELLASGNGKSLSEKESHKKSKCKFVLPKPEKTVEVELPSVEKMESTHQKTSPLINSQENVHKTFRFSLDSTSSATRFTVDILDSNDRSTPKETEIRRRSDSPSSLKRNKDKTKTGRKESSKKSNARQEARKLPSTSFSVKESNSNRFSFSSKEPMAASSPFKVKLVKQEPMTSFSISDTVNVSDDDEDIFPSSQLFDSTTDSNSLKIETGVVPTNGNSVENEYEEEEESKNFFAEIDAMAQASEEIITLSDSEDEDNPWLQRLSESQRIKEEEPDGPKPEIHQPASPEMEFVDELLELKRDLPELKTEDVQPFGEKEVSPRLDSKSTVKSPRSMSLAEIERDINEMENESDDKEDDELDSVFPTAYQSPSSKERKKSLDEPQTKVNQGTPKGPKIIEPLRLLPKKRLSSSFPSDADTSVSPSTSKGGVRVRDCSVAVPKLPSNLSMKQKRKLQLEDKIKWKKHEEEQRRRKMKNKWTQNIPLPVGRRTSPPISKNQKMKIVNQRKEKLKALATKQKLNAVQPSVEKVAVKVKAKVSTKNRGDFLIAEQIASSSKTAHDTAEASTSKQEPKSRTKGSETKSKSISSRQSSKDDESGEKNAHKEESRSKSFSSKEKKRTEKRSKSMESETGIEPSVAAVVNKTMESLKEMCLTQKENRVPNHLGRREEKEKEKTEGTMNNKKKKRVTFSEKLFTVREYQISPRNTMKKCTGKDALIPKEKLAAVRRVIDTSQQPRLEEFLMHIFQWNPSWLEEQKHLKTEPPIVKHDALVPLLTRYKSYKDYYQVLMPLLLLELWHGITKEFESIDKNYRRQTVFCSIVNNSVTFQPIPSTNTSLTTMLLEVLASEEDIRRQVHPVFGDLIFLELCYKNDEGKQNFLKVFAYITQIYRTPITPNTFFNRDLLNYTAKPSRVLTYTVLTRPLKVELCINRVLRLRCVTYLRANMRMVQALQSLPSSPLLNLIINPTPEQYQLPHTPIAKQQSSLVTRDKLNTKQLEAVFKTTDAIIRKEPKLCLVQGPPGTGKSEVIINMVMQILYGDNRYKSKESTLRILLCAPSNAAIDEIVLRLLDRRAKLTSDRFKMVRVGLLGPMHPRVKEISVEELAKRDVKQTVNSYQNRSGSMNSVEIEKSFLEAKINSLQSKLNSPQQIDENQIQFTKMKILEARTRYDLINSSTQSNGSNVSPQDLMKLQRGAENKILIGADIIACTLSSCYTNIMESAFGGSQQNISVCIVDEATQSCEAETLIPLMLGVNTLVLVGDPAQLPATIISQRAKQLGLDQSLFSRAQRALEGHANSPVIMLDVQYRMDVHISYWPNMYFYGGKLKNGLVREQPVLPFHPYRILNLDSFQNSDKFSNTQEAEFVANLIYSMINHLDAKRVCQHVITIGVITPYRNQQTLVQARINQRILPIMNNLKVKVSTEVNTVDSFQGHERDIIIMSCVRTNGIGFLSDPQRLCVALTRAKHCLVLCGNFGTFQRDTMWRALLSDARSRNNYIQIKSEAKPADILSQLVR